MLALESLGQIDEEIEEIIVEEIDEDVIDDAIWKVAEPIGGGPTIRFAEDILGAPQGPRRGGGTRRRGGGARRGPAPNRGRRPGGPPTGGGAPRERPPPRGLAPRGGLYAEPPHTAALLRNLQGEDLQARIGQDSDDTGA